MSAWLAWSAAGWHWAIYPLAAAVITAAVGGWLYYREPPGEAAQYERELDREFAPPRYLPGPARRGEDREKDRGLGADRVMASGSQRTDSLHSEGRAGELHQPRYPELDPQLRPDWLEDQLDRGRRRHARQMLMQGRWRAQMLAEIAAWAT
jgi:hypothetical protein